MEICTCWPRTRIAVKLRGVLRPIGTACQSVCDELRGQVVLELDNVAKDPLHFLVKADFSLTTTS